MRYQNATLLSRPPLEDLVHLGHALREGAAIGFLSQMVVWRVVFGSWVLGNPYGIAGAGSFNWGSPHFLDVLFSTDRGLFV